MTAAATSPRPGATVAAVAPAATTLQTPFGAILRRLVDATPGAIGGSFAAADGEIVDSVLARRGSRTWAADDWAVLTAHYGIVLGHLRSAFGTRHHGGPEQFIVEHARLEIVVQVVDAEYYALIAVEPPAALAVALPAIRRAADELAREMA